MDQKLTDSAVKRLPIPKSGNRIHYDPDVKGFGCRVTSAGARSFVLNYRTRGGRERRFTIGCVQRVECQDRAGRGDRAQEAN